MELLSDHRAQAIQIGAVLLFGILILFLSLYQAVVVPDQNEEIEFNHNEDLQQQLTELRSTVILMPGSTSTRAASLDLGVRYPSRAIFVNPGPPSGTLRTVGTENSRVNVTITNATAVDDAGETRDFWNGTALTFETGAIEYRPGYNLYQGAPRTVYEHSVLYNAFERENVTQAVAGQTLVEGSRITVIALDGSLTENRVDTLSLDVDPISTRTRVVDLNGTAKPVTLRTPTGMSGSEWNETFEDELVANGGHVQNVSVSPGGPGGLGLLEVTLEAGERYQLELAKVGVGTGATGTDAEYLTDVAGNGSTLEPGETVQLTVEARDRFNGPESGVTVTADPSGGNFTGGGSEKVTDTEGQATYEYEAGSAGTHRINFTIDQGYDPDASHETGSPTNVTMQVTVESPSNDGGGGGGGAYNSSWILPSGDGIECEDGACVFDQNRSDSDELELTMETDPTADDANVEFAVNDTETASINSSSTDDRTSADGTASVTLTPLQDGSINAYTWSGGSGDTLPITFVNVSEEPFFDVTITGTNSPVREGETLEVDVNVTNRGNAADTQTLNLTDSGFNGTERDTVDVTLAPGASNNSITLEWATSDGDAGTGDVTVFSENDSDSRNVRVNEPPFFDVTIDSVEDSVTAGDTVTVEYTVENTGDLQDTQDIVFEVNGSQETVESDVTLDGGNTFSDQFTYTTDSSDTPAIEAAISSDNDTASAVVSVEEAPFFAVAITGTNSPVTEGETLTVDVNVTNTGTQTDTQTLNLTDTGFTNAEQDTVTVTLAGGESDDSITLEWPTSDGDTGTGDVTVFSENDSDLTEVTVESPTDLSSVSATDVVPNANEQDQWFEFTLTEPLPGGETVEISLDGAQGDLINYGGGAEVVSGSSGSASLNTNSGTATITYTASGENAAGLTIDIRADDLEVDGGTATYDATFSRSDRSGTLTDSYQVARGSGTANLTAISLSDLYEYSGTQTQTIEFTPDPGLQGGERVAIDLSDAQSTSASNRVVYDSVAGTGGAGSASLNVDGEEAYVIYTAPDTSPPSTVEVDVDVSNVELDGSNVTFEAGFSRSTADTAAATFDVRTDTVAPSITPVDPQDGDVTSDDQEIINVTVTDGDSGVDPASIAVTVQDSEGNNPFDEAGVGTDGISYDGENLTIDVSAQGESYAEGQVDVTVEASDRVDNTATKSWSFVVVPGRGPMADRTYVSGTAVDTTNDGNIEFDLGNTGGDAVEISAVAVNASTDPQATTVDNDGNREFAGAGGYEHCGRNHNWSKRRHTARPDRHYQC
ncbi:hypothetical protein BRC87_11990 [Halobacteriales archaeon QS_4_66_20]|nr:MAG: hypothetical protein BRC87_11990 [Halobacteriales archaeon QS_4_66_20]